MEFICQKAGRLDAIMSEALNVPRNQIEKLIKHVGVDVDGVKISKSSFKRLGGEKIV